MGRGSGGLINGSNSFEAHMVTINVKEEALSRFTSRQPTLCVAGLQMLILSFACSGSRVAQPLLRNCSRTHRQILLTHGVSLSGTKVVDLDLLLPHYHHVSGVLVLFIESLLASKMIYYYDIYSTVKFAGSKIF